MISDPCSIQTSSTSSISHLLSPPPAMVTRRHNQTRCRLLGLPPEVRNRIYEYVLYVPTTTGKVTLVKRLRPPRELIRRKTPRPSSPYTVLALLETCRQVYEEAKAIFYYINHLRLDDKGGAREFSSFFDNVNEKRRAGMQKLTLRLEDCGDGSLFGFRRVPKCPSLEILHLELYIWINDDADFMLNTARRLFLLITRLSDKKRLKRLRLIPSPRYPKPHPFYKTIESLLHQLFQRAGAESTRASLRLPDQFAWQDKPY